MGFFVPFLVGTIVGGVVTRQIDRRRQLEGSGQVRKWWLSKDQRDSPATQPSEASSPDMTPSPEQTAGVPSDISSQTFDGV